MNVPYPGCELWLQGAEAKLYTFNFHGVQALVKERFSKKYRHPQLDKTLTQQRLNAEVRALTRCQMAGIPVPILYYVDAEANCLIMQHLVDAMTVRDFIHSRPDWETNDEVLGFIKDSLGTLQMINIISNELMNMFNITSYDLNRLRN